MKRINEKWKKILVTVGCTAGAMAATVGTIFALKASYKTGLQDGAEALADHLGDWLQDEECSTKLELLLTPHGDQNLKTNIYSIKPKFIDGEVHVRLTE